jgi:sugar fermentation stimulation protein A
MFKYPFIFQKIAARFIRRINRFVVEVETGGRRVEAYLANPGRLWELLLPGADLLLAQSPPSAKLPYTVIACLKNGRPVMLHTHLTNQVIHSLIAGQWPGLFDHYRVVRTEPAWGRHRFDLLLEERESGEEYYLEIKSTTLFEGSVAMFPDAVTKRGAAHLLKLKELSARGIRTGCLFVAMNPAVKYFIPAYHIDSAFANAFTEVRQAVELKAIAIDFDRSFTGVSSLNPLTIPYSLLKAEFADRGAYLLLIRLDRKLTIEVGKLGSHTFAPGYYVYAGSAMNGLRSRLARHLRRKKKQHWHIDYLTAVADAITPVPIVSSERLECALAQSVSVLSGKTLTGFGSTDCRCPAHLFYFAENPLQNHSFIDLIQYYRIGRLERTIEQSW